MVHDINKCYGCVYYDPREFYCYKYLGPCEVSVYHCCKDDEKEIGEVCEEVPTEEGE